MKKKHVDRGHEMTTARRTRCSRFASHLLDNNDRSEEEKGGATSFLQEIAKDSDDREVLRDALRTMLFAGRESMAMQLSRIFFFELSRRSAVWQTPSPRGNAKAARDSPPSILTVERKWNISTTASMKVCLSLIAVPIYSSIPMPRSIFLILS